MTETHKDRQREGERDRQRDREREREREAAAPGSGLSCRFGHMSVKSQGRLTCDSDRGSDRVVSWLSSAVTTLTAFLSPPMLLHSVLALSDCACCGQIVLFYLFIYLFFCLGGTIIMKHKEHVSFLSL